MMTYLLPIKIINKIKFSNIIAFQINHKYIDQHNKIKSLAAQAVNRDILVEIELILLRTKILRMIYNNNNS